MKNILKTLLKISIAGGLIYWLVQSGKLGLNELSEALKYPTLPIMGLIFLILLNLIAALRWRLILQTKASSNLAIKHIFTCNWIGAFFNTVVPGSVSGDILKIFYMRDIYSKFTKKFLFFSVFIDRLVGLFALITIGAIAGLYLLFTTQIGNDLAALIYFNLVVTLGIIIFFLVLFFKLKIIDDILARLSSKISEYWSRAQTNRLVLLKMYLISFLVQGTVISVFWFVTKDYSSTNFKIVDAFAVIPFGFIIMAIPIAPAGIGVGHFAFQKLFTFIGIDNGASLFNIYFCVFVLANLTGIIPYVLYKKKTTQK